MNDQLQQKLSMPVTLTGNNEEDGLYDNLSNSLPLRLKWRLAASLCGDLRQVLAEGLKRSMAEDSRDADG